MTNDLISAQLCILDGAWQEAADNLAIFTPDHARGTLYLAAEVAGDPEGRDELAREMIETARRAYAASSGAISLALSEAARAANEFFFNHNAALAPEARRIAGLTAVVLRDADLFIAQAGPGVTCLVRDEELTRFPEASVWFDPNNDLSDFPTPGSVPIGIRRAYTPDLFHCTLQPGDAILIATRGLPQLLSNEELVDTLANRHPDDMVAALEDIAGASNLSVIAIRFGEAVTVPALIVQPAQPAPVPKVESAPPLEMPMPKPPTAPAREIIAREPPKEPARPRVDVGAAMLSATAKSGQTFAGILSRVDWKRISMQGGRGIDAFSRGATRFFAAAIRVFLPNPPKPDIAKSVSPAPNEQSGWRIAAFVLPALLIAIGGGAFLLDQRDQQARIVAQTTQLVQQSDGALAQAKALAQQPNCALDPARPLSAADRRAALDAAQKAIQSAEQARKLSPASQSARNAYYTAQDCQDSLNGIAVVFLQAAFANLTDPKSNATRIIARWPEVLVLDRGTQRISRYLVDEVGSKAAPYGSDAERGVILKAGDKFSDRTVADLIDVFWNDNSRPVAVERSGLFLTYDLQANKWSPRAATDAPKWKNATLASGYAGNLYVLDPASNQILKYVPTSEGAWSASTTYFVPNVTADLSNALDLAIDGDVWVLRGTGAILRYTGGRPLDFKIRDLETPLSAPTAFYTSSSLASLYIADAGNRRIVQVDKVSGKFLRQFRPSGASADAFNTLKTLAVDETNRRFFIVSGNKAYLATIPQ